MQKFQRLNSIFSPKKLLKIISLFIGLFSFIWILIRVIPKPSRATYPCVQAAYPFASGFLLYFAGLLTSFYAYTRAVAKFREKQFVPFLGLLVVAITISVITVSPPEDNYAAIYKTAVVDPNNPIGEAKGVIPGRVVWYHHPDATDENWSTTSSDNYNSNAHTNIDTVERMVNESILKLTETSSIKESWDSLFVYFNKQHGKGGISYKQGEHIFIKCNFVGAFDQTTSGPTWTSPQILRAILRNLINNMSIPQENIAFGDPMVCVNDAYWNMLHAEFPNVKYIDHSGANGRTLAAKGIQTDIFYSDKGEILRDSQGSWKFPANSGDPVYSDTLYKIIEDADYMINIAPLKGHGRAGVTLCAKNHFGSHVRTTAAQLHMGLTKPDKDNPRFGYGQYRVLVDLMGHRKLGGNTMLSIVDGLWGGSDAGAKPSKFGMAPFYNDYPSSVFMSQDQVALESVCLDFLQGIYPTGKPQMEGVDDYLQQAADPTKWPENFVYDPENDGTPLTSLGIHEHWNNSIDKQYSKELGIGDGIDFIKLNKTNITSVNDKNNDVILVKDFVLNQNYPNPFNSSTRIGFYVPKNGSIKIELFNSLGSKVMDIVNEFYSKGNHEIQLHLDNLVSGIYYYRMKYAQGSIVKKMSYLK